MSKKPKPKWGLKNAGTITPYFYAGIPSFYKSTTGKNRARYFKSDLAGREATIDDLTDEGVSAFNKFYNDYIMVKRFILFLPCLQQSLHVYPQNQFLAVSCQQSLYYP